MNEGMESRIKNRHSWLYTFVISAITITICLGTLLLVWRFRAVNLTFTDLLSILLAFFAIALSALFYFQNTKMSNDFYDNTYKFTKEISVMLGRIEAGFGEKLEHLDRHYSSMTDRVDKMIPYSSTSQKAPEINTEEEKNRAISELMKKTEINEVEKAAIMKKLEEKDKVVATLRDKLIEVMTQRSDAALKAVSLYTRMLFGLDKLNFNILANNSFEGIRRYLTERLSGYDIPDDYKKELVSVGFMGADMATLTVDGARYFNQEALEYQRVFMDTLSAAIEATKK